MMTRTPRTAAVDAYSATPRGSRWADNTFISKVIARSSSLLAAAVITSLSDSEPIRMPTWGPSLSSSAQRWRTSATGCGSDTRSLRYCDLFTDVRAPHGAVELDLRHRRIRPPAGLRQIRRRGDDVQHPPAGDDQPAPIVAGRAGMDDPHAGHRLGPVDAADPATVHGRTGVPRRRHDHTQAGLVRDLELVAHQTPRRASLERGEQVAAHPGQHHLRLGIAEPGVELEHAGPVRC